jgi:hypothetical protein
MPTNSRHAIGTPQKTAIRQSRWEKVKFRLTANRSHCHMITASQNHATKVIVVTSISLKMPEQVFDREMPVPVNYGLESPRFAIESELPAKRPSRAGPSERRTRHAMSRWPKSLEFAALRKCLKIQRWK